mgnify:CR=1
MFLINLLFCLSSRSSGVLVLALALRFPILALARLQKHAHAQCVLALPAGRVLQLPRSLLQHGVSPERLRR